MPSPMQAAGDYEACVTLTRTYLKDNYDAAIYTAAWVGPREGWDLYYKGRANAYKELLDFLDHFTLNQNQREK